MNAGRVDSRIFGLVSLLAFVCIVSAALPVANAQQNQPKRVLVLYWYNKNFQGNIAFDQTFQEGMQSRGQSIEYYPEYFESNRFPGEAQAEVVRDYLKNKYQGLAIDVVVAVSDPALEFLLKYRDQLFTNVPLVFVSVKQPTPDQLNSGLTGLVLQGTHQKTVDLALKLHPGTQQLYVVSGDLEKSKRFENNSRKALQGYEGKLNVHYLTDLPLQELIATTKSLPPHSIILYAWQQTIDEQGRPLESYETLARFAPTASAPVYGMASMNVGYGLVGGFVAGSEANGSKVAEIVSQILAGKPVRDIPVEAAPTVPMFNWRELRRWGISEQQLPAGSVVKFREYSYWELYKWRIIGVATLVGLESLFIAILLIERKRRRRANESLDKLNAELEQRITQRTEALDAKSRELETFAYSVAHDLKAPLRGIDGYSRLLLEDHKDQLDSEGQTFLKTIQDSTEEMNQLIDDLLSYSRLERRDVKPESLQLQPLISKLVDQKKRELNDRNIDFVLVVNGGSVLADVNGLTQSLNNYLDNAIKFTQKSNRPRIEVGAKDIHHKCVLWVKDNGIGFDPKFKERIFDIFQRLNQPEDYPGTGVGLAIVRKAMERIGGRAWAESKPGEGATFYLEIPHQGRTVDGQLT